MKFLMVTAIVLSAHLLPTSASAAQHPTDSQGFVTDGSPQNDDAHCVGTTRQQVACRVARRAGCRNLSYMTRAEAMSCWAPEVNVYDWDHQGMFDALYCESKGAEWANNGTHEGLLQSDDMPGDAINAFEDAYYNKWVPAGRNGNPWRGTYYAYCGG